MTKKAIGLLLTLGMVATLAACGGETTPPAGGSMSPEASPSASPSPTTSP
jgi:ABC-type glycerol-3-phosphate transport system substrate-binding protein